MDAPRAEGAHGVLQIPEARGEMTGAAPSIRELGRHSIRADRPAGDSVQEDPRFDELRGMVNGLGGLRWAEAVRLSSELLSTRGKHLGVASYLAAGLFFTKGYAGLAEGIHCLSGMVEDHWDAVEPVRPRARSAAVEFLVERVAPAVETTFPGIGEADAVQDAASSLRGLVELLDKRMGTGAPAMGPLTRALRTRVEALPPSSSPESPGVLVGGSPESEPPRSSAPPSPPSVSSPLAIPEVSSDRKGLHQLRTPVFRCLDAIREETPGDPLPYHLSRAWCWGGVVALPPHVDGLTRIASPDPKLLPRWEMAIQQGQPLKVLAEAEKAWRNAVLWMAPHRHVVQALQALGDSTAPARRTVEAEVVAFLERLPGFQGLRFAGGEPLLDEATAAWVEGLKGGTSAVPPRESSHGEKISFKPPGDFIDLEAEAASGQWSLVASGVEARLAAVSSPRERFLLKVWLADRLLVGKHWGPAGRLLEALDQDIQERQLETWEPDLAATVVRGLSQVLAATVAPGKGSGTEDRLKELQLRLCRLDSLASLGWPNMG